MENLLEKQILEFNLSSGRTVRLDGPDRLRELVKEKAGNIVSNSLNFIT
jgi:hypothetical protein